MKPILHYNAFRNCKAKLHFNPMSGIIQSSKTEILPNAETIINLRRLYMPVNEYIQFDKSVLIKSHKHKFQNRTKCKSQNLFSGDSFQSVQTKQQFDQ